MTDSTIAAILFVMYVLNDQWAFRCQRVGRGILLLARDSAAAHTDLLASLFPARYVTSIWVGRMILVGTAVFAWRAWRWYGVVPVVLYVVVLGALVDSGSPWPSYRGLLVLIRDRIRAGAAGADAMLLLPVVRHIEQELEAGVHFEKATTDAWLSRAREAAANEVRNPDSNPLRRMQSTEATRLSGIEQYASDAHASLMQFVAIHDDVFAAPFIKSIRRVLPIPGIFRSVPYSEYASTLGVLEQKIARVASGCAEDMTRAGDSGLERTTLHAMSTYCEAFAKTLDALSAICEGLAREVEERTGPSFREYNASVTRYEEYRSQSMSLGGKLNTALGNFRQVHPAADT